MELPILEFEWHPVSDTPREGQSITSVTVFYLTTEGALMIGHRHFNAHWYGLPYDDPRGCQHISYPGGVTHWAYLLKVIVPDRDIRPIQLVGGVCDGQKCG